MVPDINSDYSCKVFDFPNSLKLSDAPNTNSSQENRVSRRAQGYSSGGI